MLIRSQPDRYGDLESAVCDCADMGNVCIILLEHHYAQVAATEGMNITGKQAIVGLKPSLNALDFGIRQLVSMAAEMHRQYYAEEHST